MGVRLAAVGALAAVVAAGTAIVQTAGGGDTKVPGVPAAVANASAVLERAAASAEQRPFRTPRPDQWIYTHYQNVRVKQRWTWNDPAIDAEHPDEQIIEEQWERADGMRSAFLDGGKLHVLAEERDQKDIWPPADYARLARLPTDPDRLLALVYSKIPRVTLPPPGGMPCPENSRTDRADFAYGALLEILGGTMLPPKVEAAVYRAMKKIPDVRVAVTPERQIALGRYENGWQLNEVLFDARTYRYVGQRSTWTKDPNEVMRRCGFVRTGGLNMRVIKTGVVDSAGQRPGS